MVWTYVGDALWVVALTIMFGASRQGWRRTQPGARLVVMGQPLPRGLVLWSLPAAAFLLSLWLALAARTAPGDADAAFILFGVRAVTASLAALLHLRWIGPALRALERDGAHKP